jgi:hypothetical protein
LLLPTTNRSTWPLPTMISVPVEPVRLIVSVPEVQPVNVQVERSMEPPDATLIASAWSAAVPVIAAAVAILPVPNWAAFKVAVDRPDVLAKVMPSTLRKPFTPSAAAALRSMLVPAPAVPTWITSLPAPPLYRSPAET